MNLHVMYVGKPKWVEPIEKVYRVIDNITQGKIPPAVMFAGVPAIDRVAAEASRPIKELLIGAADPVCYVVFCWGFLECMLGKQESGLRRMKYAALAYLGINWTPYFMTILRGMRPAI